MSGRGGRRGAELGSGVAGKECVEGVGDVDRDNGPVLLEAGECGRWGRSVSARIVRPVVNKALASARRRDTGVSGAASVSTEEGKKVEATCDALGVLEVLSVSKISGSCAGCFPFRCFMSVASSFSAFCLDLYSCFSTVRSLYPQILALTRSPMSCFRHTAVEQALHFIFQCVALWQSSQRTLGTETEGCSPVLRAPVFWNKPSRDCQRPLRPIGGRILSGTSKSIRSGLNSGSSHPCPGGRGAARMRSVSRVALLLKVIPPPPENSGSVQHHLNLMLGRVLVFAGGFGIAAP